MDRIFIERLVLRGIHGAHHKEREIEQEFLIDISVEFDTAKAAVSDELTDTADYVRFVEIAQEAVERNSFYLIERLAARIATGILKDERIAGTEVTIRKPAALESGIAGVTIRRTR